MIAMQPIGVIMMLVVLQIITTDFALAKYVWSRMSWNSYYVSVLRNEMVGHLTCVDALNRPLLYFVKVVCDAVFKKDRNSQNAIH